MLLGDGSPLGPASLAHDPMPVLRALPPDVLRQLAIGLPCSQETPPTSRTLGYITRLRAAEPSADTSGPSGGAAAPARHERSLTAGDLEKHTPWSRHFACKGSTSEDGPAPRPFVPNEAPAGSDVAAPPQTPPPCPTRPMGHKSHIYAKNHLRAGQNITPGDIRTQGMNKVKTGK
jgi:hypothetical protein